MNFLEATLLSILSVDNVVRQRAENELATLVPTTLQSDDQSTLSQGSPDRLFVGLLWCCRQSSHDGVRMLACVLLRRYCRDKAMLEALSSPLLASLKSELVGAVETEGSTVVRCRMGDTIAQLACSLVESSGWPELLLCLSQWTRATDATLRLVAVSVFVFLAESNVIHHFQAHFMSMKMLFVQMMQDDPDQDVRSRCLTALVALVLSITDRKDLNAYDDCLPLILTSIKTTIMAGNESAAQQCLEAVVDLLQSQPSFVRPHLVQVCTFLLDLAENSPQYNLDDGIRFTALEGLVTLAESGKGMTRRLTDFIQRIITLSFHLMTQLEDEGTCAAWDAETVADHDNGVGDDEETFFNGEDALSRLIDVLGTKTIAPIAFTSLPALITASSWKQRFAGLLIVGHLSDPCHDEFLPHLDSLVSSIVKGVSDVDARVVWAALNALGELSEAFGDDDFSNRYHSIIFPALSTAMLHSSIRIRRHASTCLVDVCRVTQVEVMRNYVASLLEAIICQLRSPQTALQGTALSALAALASVVKDMFNEYYDAFMPSLLQIISQTTSNDGRLLRGKAIECAGLIGLAVGCDRFRQDARFLLNILVPEFLEKDVAADDPQAGYVNDTWIRLCETLGQEFIPYLPKIVPPMLITASKKPEIVILEDDGLGSRSKKEGGMNFVDMKVKGLGNMKIGMNTSAMEAVLASCGALLKYMQVLRGGYLYYLDTAQVMVTLVTYPLEDVRSTAIEAMPAVLCCASEHLATADPTNRLNDLHQFFNLCVGAVLQALIAEPYADAKKECVDSIAECITIAGEASIDMVNCASFCEAMNATMLESYERREELMKQTEDEDFDEEDGDQLQSSLDEETNLVISVGEALAAAYSANPTIMTPFLQSLMPAFSQGVQLGGEVAMTAVPPVIQPLLMNISLKN